MLGDPGVNDLAIIEGKGGAEDLTGLLGSCGDIKYVREVYAEMTWHL